MKHRLLLLLTMCLLAGCMETPDDQTPQPTLHIYTPDSYETFGAVVLPALTATPGGIEVVDQPALTLIGPVCYASPSSTLICQGWIKNPLEIPYANISLSIELRDTEGRTGEMQIGTIARDWLLPGSGAPYRVIFPEVPRTSVTPIITLLTADPSHVQRITPLEVQQPDMQPDGNQVRVRGQVYNATDERMAPVRVVITLQDVNGQVAGFREIEIEQLMPGLSAPFDVLILPQGATADQVIITADGYVR